MSRIVTPSWKQGFARNAAESAYPNCWKGLVGAWVPALGPTGATLYDVSGYGNHGTLTNMDPATDWVTNWLDLAGDDDYIAIPKLVSDMLSNIDVYTVGMRVRFDDVNTLRVIWAENDQNGFGDDNSVFEFNLGRANGKLGFIPSSEAENEIVADVVINRWYHVVGVKTPALAELFIDGVSVGTKVTPDASTAGLSHNIGRPHQDLRYFDGQIREVYVYDRALSFNEIAKRYANPNAPFTLRRRPQVGVDVGAPPVLTVANAMHHYNQMAGAL